MTHPIHAIEAVEDTGFSSYTINHGRSFLPPTMTADETAAIEEVLSLYYPYGSLRTFTTYFRPGAGLPMYVGHGQYFDFDYVLRRVLGLSGLSTGFGAQVYGGGKGHDLFGMLASSAGEGIERVLGSFAYLTYQDRIVHGSYKELRDRGLNPIHPSTVEILAPEQYDDPENLFDVWTEDTPLGWMPGNRLFSGEEVWVPAQLIMLFYFRKSDEPSIGLAPSGGLASHITRKEALYHGICELFERDAVNIRWYSGIPLDRIVIDRPIENPKLRRLLEATDRDPGEMNFYIHNLDLTDFPVVTALQFDKWYSRFGYYAGGGVGDDIEEVMISALTEFSQAERSLKVCLAANDWEFSDAFSNMFDIHEDARREEFSNFIQVVPFYGYESNQEKAAWYFDEGKEVPLSSLPTAPDKSLDARWDYLEGVLKRQGWDPVVFDFTPDGMQQTSLMKVFMPELSSPYPPSAPGLGHSRYYDVPVATGHAEQPPTYAELTKEPLPYP